MLGLTDAVPIIAIAFAALLMFANPFLGQVG
jgi:F0F1-type ATP synthase membrane subunit c/vacuolar-type H+-ATPase subunit K